MAEKVSFKQQCPSCEAMVPIKDHGLIGRKIDCPKCKYRFVVEEPVPEADEDEDEAPAPAKKKGNAKGDSKDAKPAKGAAKGGGKAGPRKRGGEDGDGKPEKKKKAGGSGMLIIGGGLGLAGVVAIVVCAIALWPSGEGDKGSGGSGTSSGATAGGGAAPPMLDPNAGAPPTPPPEKKPSTNVVLVNVSNLLPNDSQAVLAYPMPMTLGSSLKAAAMSESEGGYRPERFRQTMGFEIEDLNRVVTAMNAKDGWVFTILQTKKPFNQAVLKTQLQLAPQPQVKSKSGKMHEVFLARGEMDSLSNLLVKVNLPRDTMQVHVYDANTLVFADPQPMQKFLEADGKPEYLTKEGAPPPPPRAAGADPNSGGAPGAVGGGPGSVSGPGAAGADAGAAGAVPPPGGAPGAGMMGGTGDGTTPPPQPVAVSPSSWMTVDQSLKLLMDRLEKLEENKATRRKEPVSVVTVAGLVDPLRTPIMTELDKKLNEEGLGFLERVAARSVIDMEMKRVKTAGVSLIAFDQRKAETAVALEYRDRKVAEQNEKQYKPLLEMVPMFIRTGLGLSVKIGTPVVMDPNAPGGMGPGGADSGGISGGARGFPPPGGIPMPGGTGDTPMEEKNDGVVMLVRENEVLVLSLDLTLSAEAYEKILNPTREIMQLVKGQSDLATSRPRYHELANALQAYLKEKNQFPPGAMPRAPNAERGLPWRPDQRLSWAVALLPYLGDDTRDWRFDLNAGWNEGRNSSIAMRIIPALVAHREPATGSTMISYPGMHDHPFAATHFVGVAGLGHDAAEYKLGDPATAKKIGLIGYDRAAKRTDVTDGPAQTIAFLMVPGEHKAPWLAGGGATVRAVSDDADDPRPIAPFICTVFSEKSGEKTRWTGKKGTIAIMADGKVRFIPEDLPADTFRALCTIAGGDTVSRLDSLCPSIEEPERREIRTTTVPGVAPGKTAGGTDQDKLQGTWELVSLEIGGTRMPDKMVKAARLTFSGANVTIQMGTNTERGTIKLDPSKSPKTLDLSPTDGPNKGKTSLGIYEFSGDQLKVCSAKDGDATRPTAFTSPVGSTLSNFVLRKATGAATKGGLLAGWKEHTNATGRFSVAMPPGTARSETKNVQGTVVPTYLVETPDRKAAVTYHDVTPVEAANVDRLFATVKAGMLSQVPDGTVKDETKSTIAGNAALDFTVLRPANVNSVRILLAGGRLYILSFSVPLVPRDVEAPKAFLDSFRVTK